MNTLEPCRYCGKKDSLQVTEIPFINKYNADYSLKVRVECIRCAWSIEAVVTDADRARAIWNSANRKEQKNGERSRKDSN